MAAAGRYNRGTPKPAINPAGEPDNGAQQYRSSLREMPEEDMPRGKLLKSGAGALTESELLAIILRTGTPGENVVALSQRLLKTYGGLPGLMRLSLQELQQVHGVGEVKAIQIKATLELGRRLLLAAPEERLQIRKPDDLANPLILEMSGLEQEHLKVIMLDTKNQVLKMQTIYVGTVNSSNVRVAEIFREAIRNNATSIIVAHNHPSGDPTPSPEDVRLTEELIQAGKLLNIELLDHLVIGQQRFISLRQRGLAFHDN